MRGAGQVTGTGRFIGACRSFVREHQRNRPHGIPMRRSQDNIKTNLK